MGAFTAFESLLLAQVSFLNNSKDTIMMSKQFLVYIICKMLARHQVNKEVIYMICTQRIYGVEEMRNVHLNAYIHFNKQKLLHKTY